MLPYKRVKVWGGGEQVKVLFGFVRGYDFCNVRRKKLLQASVSLCAKMWVWSRCSEGLSSSSDSL